MSDGWQRPFCDQIVVMFWLLQLQNRLVGG